MNLPPSIISADARVHRKRRHVQFGPPPPAALTLVAAVYTEEPALLLTFDRAINIEAFDGSAVIVDDPIDVGARYDGNGGAEQETPTRVKVALNQIGAGSGFQVRLTASALSGIVAVDDGGTWAGVTELHLPFP